MEVRRSFMEIWKDVLGYEDSYQVSNKGNVRGKDRYKNAGRAGVRMYKGKPIKQNPDKDGYMTVSLSKNSKKTRKRVHRLVAEVFVEGKKEGYVVNHLDGDKSNNEYNNLEWCTRSENDLHAFRLGLRVPTDGGTSIPVKVKDSTTGEIINTYQSLTEASEDTGLAVGSIHYRIHKENKTNDKYIWELI